MCALKEDLLSIMHIIICLTKVTIWLLGGFWLADPTRDPPSVRIPREIEDDNADISASEAYLKLLETLL